MKIKYTDFPAWCHELQKTVTGADVWMMRYGKPAFSGDLTFGCADENCRARMVTRNCHRVKEPHEAYFRLYQNAFHTINCTYVKSKKRALYGAQYQAPVTRQIYDSFVISS